MVSFGLYITVFLNIMITPLEYYHSNGGDEGLYCEHCREVFDVNFSDFLTYHWDAHLRDHLAQEGRKATMGMHGYPILALVMNRAGDGTAQLSSKLSLKSSKICRCTCARACVQAVLTMLALKL